MEMTPLEQWEEVFLQQKGVGSHQRSLKVEQDICFEALGASVLEKMVEENEYELYVISHYVKSRLFE